MEAGPQSPESSTYDLQLGEDAGLSSADSSPETTTFRHVTLFELGRNLREIAKHLFNGGDE